MKVNELVQMIRVFTTHVVISSQLSCNSCSRLTKGMRVEKTLMQTLASRLTSTLMQLLFSFNRVMRVEKTLMQILASQLSCNSCSH